MSHADLLLFYRIAVAAALSFALGFEREVRGAPAGDRTYSLVGVTAAAVTAVTFKQSPQAVAGVLTGIGFVGGALIFRETGGMIKGVTSAATIFAVAGIGIVAGAGHLLLAVLVTGFVMIDLELRHIPGLRFLDGRRWRGRVDSDEGRDDDDDDMEEGRR